MADFRKYKVAVADDALTRRADHELKADNVGIVEGHLYFYAEGRCIAVYAPGGWRSYIEMRTTL